MDMELKHISAHELAADIKKGMSVEEIVEKCQMTPDNLPLGLGRLAEKGLLTKSEVDKHRFRTKICRKCNGDSRLPNAETHSEQYSVKELEKLKTRGHDEPRQLQGSLYKSKNKAA